MRFFIKYRWIFTAGLQALVQLWIWTAICHFVGPDRPIVLQWYGLPLIATIMVSVITGVLFCAYQQDRLNKRS